MNSLDNIYERFKHLDGVFRDVDSSCGAFQRAARDLWLAICDERDSQRELEMEE